MPKATRGKVWLNPMSTSAGRRMTSKSKIREGRYVDLGALSSPTDTAVSVAKGNNGQPTISLTPDQTTELVL